MLMPSNIISDEKLLKRDTYKSIMYLIENYEFQNFERVGLTHGQLLYALKKRKYNHKTKYKMDKHLMIDEEMEEFFTKKSYFRNRSITLEEVSSHKEKHGFKLGQAEIYPGCITSPYQLNNCLQELIKRGWVEPTGKPKYYIYFTSENWHADKVKRKIFNDIEMRYSDGIMEKKLFDIRLKNRPYKPIFSEGKNYHDSYVLFGITKNFLDKLNDNEKKHLNSLIEQANESLSKIIELKYEKMNVTPEQSSKMSTKKYRNLCTIGFYYHAVKDMDM